MTDWLKPHQFKEGQSGNPAGKPKGLRNRSTIVREAIEAILQGRDQQVVDAMTAAIIEKAVSGDVQAYKELMDSAYGKNADTTKHEGGQKLEIIIKKEGIDL